MTDAFKLTRIRPIHPFPARMAPAIIWDNLPEHDNPLHILDPMAGSGTSLVVARAKGHRAVGCDTDPLAVLIARAWCSDFAADDLRERANLILAEALELEVGLALEDAYPIKSDAETREFVNFWFDGNSRLQLSALSRRISQVNNIVEQNLLWVAFSRLIITKTSGVSLAMDVSHSRPHRKYEKAPVNPFDKFPVAVEYVINKAPFCDKKIETPLPMMERGDARFLSYSSQLFDLVVTSPPYLNAIDYMRGHRLALVWMGYSVSSLRSVRSSNIGSERSMHETPPAELLSILRKMGNTDNLQERYRGIVLRYLDDMGHTLSECRRVLKPTGEAIFVVGNSAIRGVRINNSDALIDLAQNRGFRLASSSYRPLPQTRRYLPPPESARAGEKMQNRMREEAILRFIVA